MLKNTLLPVGEFLERRARLFARLPDSSITLIRSGQEITRSNDTEYHFCPNKNFYYLTGFKEPDALLVLLKTDKEQSLLFCRDKDPIQEVWQGKRAGPNAAIST